MPNITFENFYEEVKLFCHGQPKKADGLGAVVRDVNSDLAQAWIKYANDKGWPQRAKFFEKMLKQGNPLTMPCADPRKFDPEYNPPRAFEPRREDRAAPERRVNPRTIADQIRETAKNSRPPNERRRKDWKPEAPPPKTQAEIESDIKAKNRAEPACLSPTLRAHLGLPPSNEREAAE